MNWSIKSTERKIYEVTQFGGLAIGIAMVLFFGRKVKNVYRDDVWDKGFDCGVDWAHSSLETLYTKENEKK